MNTYTKIGIATLTIPFLLTSCNAPLEQGNETEGGNQTTLSSWERNYERRKWRDIEWNQNQSSNQAVTTSPAITTPQSTGWTIIEKDLSYRTPSGTITTTFSIGVDENKTLTSINATTSAYDHHDQQYHSRFNRSESSLIGKKIDEINVDSLGGATLTTEAFIKVIQAL